MRALLGAGALLAATLVPLTGASQASAGPSTDITPPAIGSCFDLSYDQVRAVSSSKPAVDCSTEHTTMTFDVVEFSEAPDWNDQATYEDEIYDQCNLSWIEVLGGNPRTISMSSYTYFWLLPTPAQREAGAAWVRCELALSSGARQTPIPQNVRLRRLPLEDAVARCREASGSDYRLTVCSRPHHYRATYAVEMPGRWRGEAAAKRFAYKECDKRTRAAFNYQWQNSRYWWRLGFRYAICSPRNRH